MQTIYLDISNKLVVPTIYAKQGDVGRRFEVFLTDSGLPYVPASGSAFSVWYSGASGEGNYTDIGDKSAFSVNGNKVAVELITQMFAVDGEGLLCLVLNGSDGSQIASWNIKYVVESIPGAMSEQANAYYTAFSRAVENLPYPDESLSVKGKAADAAAVGKALEGKAPAGYGLGANPIGVTESTIDATVLNGWYAFVPNTFITLCNITFRYGHLRVDNFDGNTARQTLYILSGKNIVLRRERSGGVFGEWECENPPMEVGVEYRTTERHNGKVVYAKLVNCGAMPTSNATKQVVYLTDAYATEIVRHSAYIRTDYDSLVFSLPYTLNQVNWCVQAIGKNAINLYASYDASGYTAYVTVWYTKD